MRDPKDVKIGEYNLAEILERHKHWYNEDVNGWEEMMADLSGADLSGVNLSRVNLYGADLSGANLSGADLSGANLYGANLSGANLSGTNLSGANLSGANLSGTDLSRAKLSGVRANLSGTKLSGANLSGANLSEANLSGANLSGANLSGANLYGADLSGADLPGANLSGADLSGAKNVPYRKAGKEGIMKIVQVDDLGIEFDNGSRIVFDYDQYCREDVCVKFEKISDLARSHDYDEELVFEKDPKGFLFGDKKQMFLVPCFSIPMGCNPCFCIHDGCYSGTLYYRGKAVLGFRPENRVQRPADPIK